MYILGMLLLLTYPKFTAPEIGKQIVAYYEGTAGHFRPPLRSVIERFEYLVEYDEPDEAFDYLLDSPDYMYLEAYDWLYCNEINEYISSLRENTDPDSIRRADRALRARRDIDQFRAEDFIHFHSNDENVLDYLPDMLKQYPHLDAEIGETGSWRCRNLGRLKEAQRYDRMGWNRKYCRDNMRREAADHFAFLDSLDWSKKLPAGTRESLSILSREGDVQKYFQTEIESMHRRLEKIHSYRGVFEKIAEWHVIESRIEEIDDEDLSAAYKACGLEIGRLFWEEELAALRDCIATGKPYRPSAGPMERHLPIGKSCYQIWKQEYEAYLNGK